MKAGASKIDITPEIGVWLDGIPREKPSDSIVSPLYARSAYFSNEKTEVCIVVCDLIGLHEEDVKIIKSEIKQLTGITENHIVIASTHTHSGPSTLGILAPKEKKYVKDLPSEIAKGVKSAKETAEPCKIKVSYGYETTISEYRRLKDKNGKIWMNWEDYDRKNIIGPAGPDDPEVGVITASNYEDRPILTLFNHTGHPNTLTGFDYAITSDYPGEACRLIEESVGGTAIFFNGAQGSSDIPGFNDRNPEGIKKRGKALFKVVRDAMNEGEYSFTEKLGIINARVPIKRRYIPEKSIAEAKRILAGKEDKTKNLRDGVDEDIYAQWLIDLLNENREIYYVPFNGIRIGNAFIFTVPAELFTEIGLNIKKFSPFTFTYIMGLTDGYYGYIPTKRAIQEGGYATRTGSESRFSEDAEKTILQTAIEFAKELL